MLVYDGRTADPRPVIQARVQTPNSGALPSTVGVELIWNGVSQGTDTLSTTGLFQGDLLTIGVRAASAQSTGRHHWEIRVKVSGNPDLVDSGVTYVVDQTDSPFGAGWNLSILNRLVDIPADSHGPDGKLWVYGNGAWRFFEGSSTFTSPAEDNGILAAGGGGFIYTTPEQTKIFFNSSGEQTGWESADGKETMTFTWSSGLLTGITAIDGSSSTLSYTSDRLTGIAAPGSRSFTTSIVSDDLVSITNPDGGVHAFEYVGHQMTRETFGTRLENRWGYDGDGVLDEFTWGNSSSPSVFALVPVAAFGLGAFVRGEPRAVVTDPLGHQGQRT